MTPSDADPTHSLTDAELSRIGRFVLEALPLHEREITRAWIAEHPEREAWAADMHRVSQAGVALHNVYSAQTAREQLHQHLGIKSTVLAEDPRKEAPARIRRPSPTVTGNTRSATSGSYVRARSARRSYVAAARWTAFVGASLGVAWLAVTYPFGKTLPNTAPAATAYVTKAGERANLTLRDGSLVTLGPATTVRIQQADEQGSPIAVDVDGEAFFAVAHVSKRPFTVTAHGVSTRVLGTEFVVRAYEASKVRVAVRNGRVSVQSPNLTASNAVIIGADQAASVTPSGRPVVTAMRDRATDFSWIDGQLVLHEVPLGEALTRLSRWYGLEFRASDPALLDITVETAFPLDYNEKRLQDLGRIIDATVVRAGNVVTFTPIR